MSWLRALSVIDDCGVRSAAMQMSVDEALLGLTDTPVLRFYDWRRASISFGYFGRFADVAKYAATRELVRRWTGGGVVFHGDDLTYSLAIPASDPIASKSAREIYSSVHLALQSALRSVGIETSLLNEAPQKISEACFVNPVRADLLRNGRKIAGAAQRRTRAGLLHQGSIQVPDLPETFRTLLASALCPEIREFRLSAKVIEAAATICERSYGTPEWLIAR